MATLDITSPTLVSIGETRAKSLTKKVRCNTEDGIISEGESVGTFGRYEEVRKEKMSANMRAAYDLTIKVRGQLPGPHKIWLSNRRLSETIVPTGAYYQTESTLSKAEIKMVTSVTNGADGWQPIRTVNTRRSEKNRVTFRRARFNPSLPAFLPRSRMLGSRSSMNSHQHLPHFRLRQLACISVPRNCCETWAL